MKKIIFSTLFTLLTGSLMAQNITGDWHGILNARGTQIKLTFHIQKTDSGYSATFDSPDQGAEDIPFTSATFNDRKLILVAQNIGATYQGTFEVDSITGTWMQSGQSFPLNLSKKQVAKKAFNRPQYPEKPYPYREEDVFMENTKDSLILAGTLTLPDKPGPLPVVILISGSGPQNRDEEVFGHKPFLVLADYLTRQGIAVLRYDDRGTAESTGSYSTATTKDFATDVLSAIEYLKNRKEIDQNNMGLIGHSEGGIIAPLVADQSDNVTFIVLLAGTGVPGKEISLMQAQTLKNSNMPDEEGYKQFTRKAIEIASSGKVVSVLKKELTQHYKNSEKVIRSLLPEGANVDAFINQQVEASLSPWARFFYNYNPADELKKVIVPVLSLNGSNDMQVNAEINQGGIREALQKGGNKNYLIKELPDLNHMFQESKTGAISEYTQIEQTFSPVALKEISRWIKEHIKES